MSAPIFDAELEVACQCTLGEGIMWDDKTELLHWVDIDEAKVHSYDPVSKAHSVAVYPETGFVSAIAPRVDGPGLVAGFEFSVALINPPAPTAAASSTPITDKATATVAAPLTQEYVASSMVRFNDGACDPAGRFVIGSMTRPEKGDGILRGELFSVDPKTGASTKLLESVGCSNGIDWSLDGKTMYYVDSNEPRVSTFDYDVATGAISNRQTLVSPPADIDGRATVGAFDGLVVDGAGNIWVARWADQRIVGYTPRGEVIAHIRVPGVKSPTIPCFGGKDLSTMYIATASANLAGAGDIQAQFPQSGDVFKIECGPGSPLGKVLGDQWKGRVRHRFAA